MKRDGRKLDHKTLEEIRRMAVQRVWDGEKPSAVIASYGFSRQTIYKWLREAKGRGRGLRALRSRKGTGRPRSLTAKQEQQLFRWINGKDPRQHGFDFGLWTRMIVRKLIADKFGVNLSITAVGKLLARLGLTPQKPLKRAYERLQLHPHPVSIGIAQRSRSTTSFLIAANSVGAYRERSGYDHRRK